MEFKTPVTIQFSGQELATVWLGLMKLPGEMTYDLLKRIEQIEAVSAAESHKVPSPPMKLVSGELV